MDQQIDPSMQTLQRFAVTAVFTLTCYAIPVVSARAAEAGGKRVNWRGWNDFVPSPIPQVELPEPVDRVNSPAGLTNIVAPANPAVVVATPRATPGGSPNGGAAPAGNEAIDDVKARLERTFKKEREELQNTIQAARKAKLGDLKRSEREKGRERLSSLNDAAAEKLMELQRALLEISFEDLKSRRSEHRELIEAAKEAIKERARERTREKRGYGDR